MVVKCVAGASYPPDGSRSLWGVSECVVVVSDAADGWQNVFLTQLALLTVCRAQLSCVAGVYEAHCQSP